MKRRIKVFAFVCGMLSLGACTSNVDDTIDADESIESTVENEVSKTEDNSEVNEVVGLTCEDLIKQYDDVVGTEVTISAYSWGTNGVMNGNTRLNLGDMKLEGMRQAGVSAEFGKDDAESLSSISMDDWVIVKGTVGEKAYGTIIIENPQVVTN